jgi:hypothetical protein
MPDTCSSLLIKLMVVTIESELLSSTTLFKDYSLHSLALQYVSCCHSCHYYATLLNSLALQAVSGCLLVYSFKAVD